MFKRHNIISKALAKLKLMQQELVEESQVLGELEENEDADECEFKTLQAELSAKTDALSSLTRALKERDAEIARLEAALNKSAEDFKVLLDKKAELPLRLDELNAANQRLLRTLWDKEEAGRKDIEAAKSAMAAQEALAASLKEELKQKERENKLLSQEFVGKAAEYKAALDKERAEFRLNYEKIGSGAAQAEKEFLSELQALKNTIWHKDKEAARADAAIKALAEKGEALAKDYEERLLKLDALNASLREDVKKKIQETDALSREARSQAAEFKRLLDTEREESKTAQAKDQKEIRELSETVRHIRREMNRLHLDLEAAKEEHAAVKTQRDSLLIKTTEQEIFTRSAESALKDKQGELKTLQDRLDDISSDLSKKRNPF